MAGTARGELADTDFFVAPDPYEALGLARLDVAVTVTMHCPADDVVHVVDAPASCTLIVAGDGAPEMTADTCVPASATTADE